MSEHIAENDAPTCRACYAATLTPDERDRLNSEPVTGCVYLCPEHEAALTAAMRPIEYIKAKHPARFDFPRVIPPACGCPDGECHEAGVIGCYFGTAPVIPPGVDQ